MENLNFKFALQNEYLFLVVCVLRFSCVFAKQTVRVAFSAAFTKRWKHWKHFGSTI